MRTGNPVKTPNVFFAAVLVLLLGCDGVLVPSSDRVWSLTREGARVHPRAAPQKSVLVPLPGWHWAGPPYGCLPTLALGPKGEAIVTSDTVPTLWRIDPDTLAVTVHELTLDADNDRDVGFSQITWSAELGSWLAVSPLHGSYWEIDAQLRRARKLPSRNGAVAGCRRESFN